MVSDLSTLVQIHAHAGNKTGGTLKVSAVLLIEWNHPISLTSVVKSNRTSERGDVGYVVAQWLSAVGE